MLPLSSLSRRALAAAAALAAVAPAAGAKKKRRKKKPPPPPPPLAFVKATLTGFSTMSAHPELFFFDYKAAVVHPASGTDFNLCCSASVASAATEQATRAEI